MTTETRSKVAPPRLLGSCPCSWCGVTLHYKESRPDLAHLVSDSYPCGHARCFCCRREHPDCCWVCNVPAPWTTDDAFAVAVQRIANRASVKNAILDFKGEVSRIVSGSGGGSGPHSPSYEVRGHHVSVWPPYARHAGKAPWTFTVEAVLRAAMPVTKNGQGKLL